jgi:DNA-binding MarR family transcriptional regulator
MTKQRAKRLIDDRAYGRGKEGRYTRVECSILKAIVDGTPASGRKWQDFDVSTGICSTSQEELARKTNSVVRTVIRAIKKFELNGHVKVSKRTGARGQDQYTATLEGLENLPTSKEVRKRLISAQTKRDRTQYWKERYMRTKAALDLAQTKTQEVP